MSQLSLLFTFLSIFCLNILIAQPKIVFNTDQSKNIRVRSGDTLRLNITVGNYGDTPIDENYRISAFFNSTGGFLSSTRYVLRAVEQSGIALDVNEQKQFTFEYLIPEDTPEVNQNLIFTAFDDKQSLHTGGGYLFLRINIKSRDPLPDLIVLNYRFPRIQSIYTELFLQFDVLNRGELLSFENTDVKVYLSSSGVLDKESILMESYEVSPLVVGDEITIKDTLNLAAIPPAVYRLIIVVDQENRVRENDEVNNVFNFGFPYPINGNNFPDLFFSIVDFPRELFIGDPTANQKIRTVIWNQTRPTGIASINISVPICNHLYLSTDNRFDESDRLLGTAVLSNGIGGDQTAELTFTPNECFESQNDTPIFSSNIEAGRYYLIMVLDAENEVVEYFENNNTLTRRILLSNLDDNFSALITSKISPKISLCPNPVSERLVIRYKSNKAEKTTPFALHDVQGKLIFDGKWQSLVGQNQQELDLSTVEQGVYFLKIGNIIQRVSVVK